jgi:hypothetical protein
MFTCELVILSAPTIYFPLQEAEITVDPSGDYKNLSSNYHFVLLELLGSHYASVCVEKDSTGAGSKSFSSVVMSTLLSRFHKWRVLNYFLWYRNPVTIVWSFIDPAIV